MKLNYAKPETEVEELDFSQVIAVSGNLGDFTDQNANFEEL